MRDKIQQNFYKTSTRTRLDLQLWSAIELQVLSVRPDYKSCRTRPPEKRTMKDFKL